MKQKRFFRWILMLLCLSLSLIAFAACGANVNRPDVSPPSVPSLPEIPESPTLPPDQPTLPPNGSHVTEYVYYLSGNTNGLHIRSGAGTQFASVGQIDKGDMLRLDGEDGDWYRTVYLNKTAYVSKNYVSPVRIAKGSDAVERVVTIGENLLGSPYVFGAQRYHWGNGVLNSAFQQGVFDCSSFTQYIYYHGASVLLDVVTRSQVANGKDVTEYRRGDLLFYTNASRKDKVGIERIGHVAVYLGNGYLLHTASDYAVIETISPLRESYFISARRVI